MVFQVFWERAISIKIIWMTVWLYGFLCMINFFYCTYAGMFWFNGLHIRGVMHQHVYDDNETFYYKGICGVYDNYGTGLIRWNGTRIYHHDGIVVI